MQKLKRPVSVILSILMVVSMFVVVPFTASAAVGDSVSKEDYLTFTAEEAGSSVTLKVASGSNLQYSLDGGELIPYTPGTTITLANVGDSVSFRGGNTIFTASNHVTLTGKVACSGNVMSLRLDDNGKSQGLNTYCFESMFEGCTGLTSAPELPETDLKDGCYRYMFFGCTNLTTAPELPATMLAEDCYRNMFSGCASLTTAPELPATTLARYCYTNMFSGCKSLTTAPELQATSLALYCYGAMFAGCTSLTELPALPATTLERGCYGRMFYGCSSIKLSETQTAEYSIQYRVPSGGNGTTASNALDNMFAGTGGTFTGTPEISKTYYVTASAYVAFVNGSGYKTFEEAVAARATNDDVITLFKNYDGTYTMAPGKLVVDKNGCTFNKPAVEGAYLVGGTSEGTVYTYTTTEAAIEYTSLSGAVSYKSNIDYANLNSNGTYKLLKDITANSRITPTVLVSNVTIDLNGHTLTSTATNQAFLFSRSGSASNRKPYTITDTSTNGGGKIIANNLANTGTDNTAAVISASGNYNDITISNVTIETTQGIALLGTNQTLTIDNCDITVTGADDYALSTNGSLTNGATITVTDSSITATNGIGVYLPGGATSTFTNTDVTGTTAMYIKSGTTTINGGTYTATGAAAEFTHNGNGANATGDAIVIESCNYPNGVPTVSIGADDVVSAHGVQVGDYTYQDNPAPAVTATSNTMTLPEGLKWVEKSAGVYEVAPDYVASVNGSGYMTFAEAVAARTSTDDVITLIKAAGTYTSDDHTEFPIKVQKNGKSLTVNIDDAPYYTTNSASDGVTTYVAVEGKVKYTSTNGTVTYKGNIDYSNIGGSGTYQLLDDITATTRIVPGLFASNVTVDLNGHTLTSTATDEAFLFSRAGSASSHNSYTITNGKIIAAGDGIQLLANNADLTLDGVTINASGDYGIVTNGTKTGNNITVTDSVITADDAGIYKPSNGTLTLTNTTVEGKVAVYVKSGTVAINGGTFTGTGAKADYTYNGNGINPTGDAIVIDSCGYPGGAPSVSIGGNPTINSTNGVEIGDYAGNGVTELAPVTATDNTLTLPEGLKWVEKTEGVYEVAPKNYVAQIGNTKYEDLQAALNEVQDGETITILTNIALTGSHWFVVPAPNADRAFTIDLDGKTISSEDSVFVIRAGNDVTVTNGELISTVANDYVVYNEGKFTLAADASITDSTASGNGIIARSGSKTNLYGDVTTGYYAVAAFGTSEVNVYDGADLTSTDACALSGNGSTGNEGYTFNVYGGNLTSTNDVAIYHPNQGTLNIKGGTITGATAIYVKSGSTSIADSETNISSATIVGNGAAAAFTHSNNGCVPTGDAIVIENCGYPGGTPDIDISGGTISSTNAKAVASYGYDQYPEVGEFVSGGTFNTPVPEKYCAQGYTPKDNGDGTYTVTEKLFTGHSINLGGDIGVNFFINSRYPALANANSAKVRFTWDDEYTAEVDLKALTPDATTGYYKATVDVVAAHMNHPIRAEIFVNGTQLTGEGKTDEFKVQTYAKELYDNPEKYVEAAKTEELQTLAQALLNYGSEAQVVFDKYLNTKPERADSVFGKAPTYSSSINADAVKAKIKGTASNLETVAGQLGNRYFTNSLIYLSKNTLRIYFIPPEGKSTMPNSGAYDGHKLDYYYYVQKTNIAAAELDNVQTFNIAGKSFSYSPLNYVADVLETTGEDTPQNNLAKSVYLYNQAANAYFG